MQKRILYILLISIVLFGCNNQPVSNESTNLSENNAITPTISNINEDIINDMISYYKQEYEGIYSVEKTDSTVNVLVYSNSTDDVIDSMILFSAYIPLKVSGYIKGDLDNDGIEEIICDIPTEGGGGGGNTYWNDLFVYKQTSSNRYKRIAKSSSPELLGGCYLSISHIKQNEIIGTSLCYDENDGHCCPSLSYNTTVVLKNDSLVVKRHIFVTNTDTLQSPN